MTRRSKDRSQATPEYDLMGKQQFLLEIFGIIELKDFERQAGYDKERVRFWNQFGHSLHMGVRCLENYVNVYVIVKYISKNKEVDIYLEHLDSNCEGFSNSNYGMEEDDRLFDRFVDTDVEFDGIVGKGKSCQNKFMSDEMYARMEVDNEEEVEDNDELKSVLGFDEESKAKSTIETYCLRRGMVVKFDKNNDKSWQLKGYNPVYNKCSWNYNNLSLRSCWIGKTFMKKFKDNLKLGTNELRSELCITLKANVSKQPAYRAKQKALKLLQGSLKEQFSKIRDYCQELLRSSPRSTIVLKLSEVVYMFEACEKWFKDCRKVIKVDDCFLKGPQGGQLLTIVGVDLTNMFPIAYAVAENENKDSCVRFFTLLDNDIGFKNQYAWTFMSDKQKRLIPAFESLFPDIENRFSTRATRIEEFKVRMEYMKELDENALYPKCGILQNMCESFNSFTLAAYMDKAKKWDNLICPKIKIDTVDVFQKSCSCRTWDLTRIPCRYAISKYLKCNKFILRGGINFITMPNLRAAIGGEVRKKNQMRKLV
ncbi:hypothetical protein Pfo_000319 [Paulownia fortunei]|nr:hypothetical protein Pfo_000319 [Paulownia fortunei]